MKTNYLYFMNKKNCLLIYEKACQHLFIKLNNDKLICNTFSEKGLFKHHLIRGNTIEISLSKLKFASFFKKNGVLWLKLSFNLNHSNHHIDFSVRKNRNRHLDQLIIAPKNWKEEKYSDFIYKINEISPIGGFKYYEKYLRK